MPIPANFYRRTVVVTDLHGDLDILLRSLAAKSVLRYRGDIGAILEAIENAPGNDHIPELEATVIHQCDPLLLVFLGDMVDRWTQGYQLLRFLSAIRWERFFIEPVFIIGNHDMQNFQFFVNPFKAYSIHLESGHDIGDIVHYISEIGMTASMESFAEAHGEEIRRIQEDFYRTGVLDWDLGYATLDYMDHVAGKEAYFLNRMSPQVGVYQSEDNSLIDFREVKNELIKHNLPWLEKQVYVGSERYFRCRMIVSRAPTGVSEKDRTSNQNS